MEKPRTQLPPLRFDVDYHLPPERPSFGTSRHSVKRRRSWDEVQHRPRGTRKTYTFSTIHDMETYNGHVRTPADAIILFEACRLGLLPRVQRRLSEKERSSIKSGSVFVWDEREAGMRRWTDGKSWSASRVSGSFLTYREMEGKRGGGGGGFPAPVAALSKTGRSPDAPRGSDSDLDMAGEEGPDGYRYKPDGLMKQSFSITTSSGNHLHLISYYSRSQSPTSQLKAPTSDSALRHIRPQKGMYPESTVHEHQNIPAVTRSPMASAPYSTVPQMAGYARQGPPQWSQSPNSYGWPQGHSTHLQQPQYYGYQYGPSNGHYAGGPPPPHSGHSPLQYAQSAQHGPSQQQMDPSLPTYNQRRPPSKTQPLDPNSALYEMRRHPSASSDLRAPPPPQQYQQDPYANSPREQYHHPQWDQRGYPPRPGPVQEPMSTPPVQYQNRPPVLNNMPQSQYRNPSPQVGYPPSTMQYSQSTYPTNTSSTPIDPRLMGAASTTHSNDPSRSSTPVAPKMESIGDATPVMANGASQGPSIPSIGALMNGSSSENTNHGQVSGNSADAQSDKSGGRSPNGSKKDGPQDIPSDKVGFREDTRVLQVLNRNFNNAVKTN